MCLGNSLSRGTLVDTGGADDPGRSAVCSEGSVVLDEGSGVIAVSLGDPVALLSGWYSVVRLWTDHKHGEEEQPWNILLVV
jgi:hypothetical protein